MDDRSRCLYGLFAKLLDYPTASLPATLRECTQVLEGVSPEAAQHVREFLGFCQREGSETLEEVYTRSFDITPTANLYVGYHLFGESFKRGAFLAKLQETFQQKGFAPGSELADHLSVLLRFASLSDDPDFVDPLLEEGIRPTIEKVEEVLSGTDGYGPLIKALAIFLRQECRKPVAAGDIK